MMFQPSYMQMFCNNHGLKVLHQRSFICHSCMSQNFVFINNIFGSSCHVACINYKVCSYSVGLSFHATPLPMQQLIWEIILFQSQHGCQHVNLVSTLGVWHYVTTPPPKNSSYFFSTYVFPFFTAKPNELPIQARLQKCPCLLTLTIKCKTFVCSWYTKYWKHSPSVYMYKAKLKDQHQNCIARPTFE